jgi:hypothetical protein
MPLFGTALDSGYIYAVLRLGYLFSIGTVQKQNVERRVTCNLWEGNQHQRSFRGSRVVPSRRSLGDSLRGDEARRLPRRGYASNATQSMFRVWAVWLLAVDFWGS